MPPDAADARLLPLPPPLPGSGGYQLLNDLGDEQVRWDPCRPVHYVVRPNGAPAGGSATIDSAFAQLSAATGLSFVHDGSTDEPPATDRPLLQIHRYGQRWAPVLVAWSTPVESPGLAGSVAGYAGPRPADPDGRGLRLVSGLVVLDAPQLAERPDPAVGMSVVLHELGHLAGLDHVADPDDVMAPSSRVDSYTPGALRGLRGLGEGRCFS